MMTYRLLFVALMILLLGPVFLVRGDDGGQDQLSTTVPTSNPQPGTNFAVHNSSLNYDPSKNFSSLSILGFYYSDCKSASDCHFGGAICSDKDKKCKCPIGEWDINDACEAYHCASDKGCNTDGPQVCRNGYCECAPSFVPNEQNVECVLAQTTTVMPLSVVTQPLVSTAETGNSSKSVDPKQEKESSSFPWYWFLVIAIVLLLLCGGLVAVLIFCGLCVSCGLGGRGGGGNSRKSRGTPRSSRANSKKKGKSSPKGSTIQTSKSPRSKAPGSKAKLSKAKTSKVKNSKASKF